MTRWSLFLQTLSLLHHFLGLYSFLGRAKSALRSDSDSDTGYRNGYGRARRLTLSSGTIQLRRPRVRDTEEQFESRLLQQGYLVSRKRVRRLMRLMGLEAIYRRPNTSKPAPGHRIFPYLLKGVEVNRVDQVWAADITYIPMAKGFLYLVAIMDWHSRHVLAWKLSNTMDTSFCVAALEEALGKGRPEIFNTDQGSQFTSEAFTQTLQEQRVQVSMDGKGRYLDNIFVERLWRSIKYEEVYLKAYQTVAEARTGINAYLEFYNRQRPHQALGYRTPAEVYQHGQEERGAAAEEAGLPSGLVKPSAGVGDSLNLALVLS